MRRTLRARPVILIGALAAIVTSTAPARSDAAGLARASTTPLHAAAPASADAQLTTHDLQVTPIAPVALDPGTSAERTFVVTNRTSGLRLTVRLSAVDATNAPDGGVKFASDAAASGPATWLTLSDAVATLEPKAALRVSLTVAPPGNAEPGQVIAGVTIGVDRSVRLADDGDGPKSPPVSAPVAIEVKGAPTALVSILGVKAVKDGDRGYLELTYQNGGATANTMVGELKVRGSQPRTIAVRSDVAPLKHTIERVPFDMPDGAKTVPVSVETEDEHGNQAAWSGKVGVEPDAAPAAVSPRTPAPERAATAPASRGSLRSRLVVGLVVMAFLLAAVWFGAELRRSRRRVPVAREARPPRRARRDQPAQPIIANLPVDTPAPAVARRGRAAPSPVALDTDAVAQQIGALVHAIDRLVSRLGEVAPAPPAPTADGRNVVVSPSEATARAESGAILYAPAASRPPAETFDPYDWPTEAQLDEFLTRRRAVTDPPGSGRA